MHISDVHDYDPPEYEPAKEFLAKDRKKAIANEISLIVDGEFHRLEEYANDHISALAADRAEKFLERVLQGDEDAAMALLGDKSGGSRVRRIGSDAGAPWAKVYHGTLFGTGGIALRSQIVAAHAELLRNERIADLESIVEGLTRQVVSLEGVIDNMREQARNER